MDEQLVQALKRHRLLLRTEEAAQRRANQFYRHGFMPENITPFPACGSLGSDQPGAFLSGCTGQDLHLPEKTTRQAGKGREEDRGETFLAQGTDHRG